MARIEDAKSLKNRLQLKIYCVWCDCETELNVNIPADRPDANDVIAEWYTGIRFNASTTLAAAHSAATKAPSRQERSPNAHAARPHIGV